MYLILSLCHNMQSFQIFLDWYFLIFLFQNLLDKVKNKPGVQLWPVSPPSQMWPRIFQQKQLFALNFPVNIILYSLWLGVYYIPIIDKIKSRVHSVLFLNGKFHWNEMNQQEWKLTGHLVPHTRAWWRGLRCPRPCHSALP